MKKYIPQWAKLRYQIYKRKWREKMVYQYQFSTKKNQQQSQDNSIFPFSISTEQEIKHSSFFENKTSNIDLCIESIDGLIIKPEQIFSFWQLVPEPSTKNGFKHGRNIVNGKISEEVGGGICQVSCILYINALKAGLKILERHAHSVDLYQDHERFTPLGSDATVVYGYKDLQFRNNFDFPIRIQIERKNDVIQTNFYFTHHVSEKNIAFSIDIQNELKYVTTYINLRPVGTTTYKTL